jgi:hypothetical protein
MYCSAVQPAVHTALNLVWLTCRSNYIRYLRNLVHLYCMLECSGLIRQQQQKKVHTWAEIHMSHSLNAGCENYTTTTVLPQRKLQQSAIHAACPHHYARNHHLCITSSTSGRIDHGWPATTPPSRNSHTQRSTSSMQDPQRRQPELLHMRLRVAQLSTAALCTHQTQWLLQAARDSQLQGMCTAIALIILSIRRPRVQLNVQQVCTAACMATNMAGMQLGGTCKGSNMSDISACECTMNDDFT